MVSGENTRCAFRPAGALINSFHCGSRTIAPVSVSAPIVMYNSRSVRTDGCPRSSSGTRFDFLRLDFFDSNHVIPASRFIPVVRFSRGQLPVALTRPCRKVALINEPPAG